ncbi:IS91 family transposase [Carboxylicivirga caseinilyticus]|uniref:IS91 family transposase n=1 Tax=Carboxylicivirga caseinilyticus TaxID=3417572 RepID=UPI003D336BEC|nr:transposase [Marinilabiliaceae bacterium A049]
MKQQQFKLSQLFDLHWDNYKENPKHFILPEQYKAVAAIRACRTEKLGVDHYVCQSCGEISYVYHSCKNRFCPSCSWKDTIDWADKMKNQMLDIPHRHVVFTLPHHLNNLIKANKNVLLNILFQTAAESIKDWMYQKYRLKPGIISVLHTFGEKKDWHTHIHMILSWGGIDSNYQVKQINGEYINYEFIQTKFRCKFEDKLIELFDHRALDHKFKCRIEFMRFIKQVNYKLWRIQFEPAIKTPTEVIRYIGRYSKRACISEYKITSIEGEFISFKYKNYKKLDYQGKPIIKELTLHYNDFFPRLLQHVPIPYFRLVRYYGAYAARTKAILKSLYAETYTAITDNNSDNYELPENPRLCSNCKTVKTYMYTVFKTKEGHRIFMTRFNPKKRHNKLKNNAA